jgi:fucose permease
MTVIAVIGSVALWLMYAWLLAAIIAAYLSERKGYGEKPGLASGLLLHVVGVVVWLFWPPRPESKWKAIGPFGRGRGERPDEAAPADPARRP